MGGGGGEKVLEAVIENENEKKEKDEKKQANKKNCATIRNNLSNAKINVKEGVLYLATSSALFAMML